MLLDDTNNFLKCFNDKSTSKERREYIESILKINEINYKILPFKDQFCEGYNICCFGKNSINKIIVGAHYDTCGTSGVNDNTSGIIVLLNILLYFKKYDKDRNFDVIFFDCEEISRNGSKHIAKLYKNLDIMINFDVCGYGETIVYSKSYNYNFNLNDIIKSYNVRELQMLPESDDWSFSELNFPTLSVALLPYNDYLILERKKDLPKIFKDKSQRNEVFKELEVVKTTHNGVLENIRYINIQGIINISNFGIDVLNKLTTLMAK